MKQTVDSASESEARIMLVDAERTLALAKKNTDIEQKKKESYFKAGNADRWQQHESAGMQDAQRMEDEFARRVSLLKDKIAEIEKARKELSSGGSAAAGGGTVDDFENGKLEELRTMRRDFARRKAEDAQKTQIEKLELRKRYLLSDLEKFNPDEGASNDIARQKVIEKLYETEKAITEERKRQAEATAKESSSAGRVGVIDRRPIGPSGARMNDMSKVGDGGEKMQDDMKVGSMGERMVRQPGSTYRGASMRRTLSVESMGIGDVFTRMRGMHGAVLSPEERSARDTARAAEAGEKAAGLLEKIEKNLKPIK